LATKTGKAVFGQNGVGCSLQVARGLGRFLEKALHGGFSGSGFDEWCIWHCFGDRLIVRSFHGGLIVYGLTDGLVISLIQ
jgi:hypothetical protein